MIMKNLKMIWELIHRIQNISVYDFAKTLLFTFIAYAVIDVSWKVMTHRQYDMQRLMKAIQTHFPDTELTFQNIKVVDNDFKGSSTRGGTTTPYKDAQHLYIRNGRLHKEPNYLVVFYLLPLVIIMSVYMITHPGLKVRDIPKINKAMLVFMALSMVIILFVVSILPENKYYFDRYKNPKAFTYEVADICKAINVDDYKK